MYCIKCGSRIPDDAVFCPKCGARQQPSDGSRDEKKPNGSILAAPSVQELKCPGCGAPLKPQFGEMIVTCEYCGATVSLASEGWKNISRHTMLPLVLQTKEQISEDLKRKMDRGILRRHLEEESTLETLNLGYIPYWIVPVSARTSYTAVDVGAEIGTLAVTAAVMGLAGGAMGAPSRRGGLGVGLLEGTMIGGMVGGGFGGNQNIRAYTLNENYNYPVVGVKSLSLYQPRNYAFDLSKRIDFDPKSIPSGIKVLNGDVGEESAMHIAKTNVEQIQVEKVHHQHHMVRSINSQIDVADPEVLHAPIWFAKFIHNKKEIVLVVDASSGGVINSIGIH